MIKVIIYLLSVLFALAYMAYVDLCDALPEWMHGQEIVYRCALIGALGGTIYCLRAVYLNRSVKGQWNDDWNVWYVLRPLVSLLVGAISYVFLKAGLLVLDAEIDGASSPFGFLALAFIAGLNVDRFLIKLEDIAQASWGIKPSRTSQRDSESS